jgi:hypothetical protein
MGAYSWGNIAESIGPEWKKFEIYLIPDLNS